MSSFLNYISASPRIYLIVTSGIMYCFNTRNKLKKISIADTASPRCQQNLPLMFQGFLRLHT